ncbi:DUF58 domain-containing protein [Lysobacter sp. KIS68-7]|uniref:DUF58 domain-containing protein n=1 Tax=Lysobacter sp. KIS68-7 TaxID=2904252 RepID=UPI001E58CA98|nr:DUF58 domain-containing protein [Lysobacter sp. KIS68-7]UHQ18395.1 DUF58 domain-containing protein [Lysobacter sp. KIS68-7]
MQEAMQALRRRIERFARPREPEAFPVELHRGRIYVLPTPFGLFFAMLLAAMGLGALNYNNNPALLLMLLLAGAAQTSLLSAHLQLSGLRFVALGADPVPAGTPILLRVHVRADKQGRARRGLRVDCPEGTGMLSLDEGIGDAEIALPTVRRGWLDVPRLRVSTTRPLGLVRAWSWIWPEQPLLVYPAPEADGPPLPGGEGEAAAARLHPLGDDVHHLRKYRRGDPARTIAWKPTARLGQLLVREYERPQSADIVLDWWQLQGLEHEARIRRLARWVDEAERDARRYRLAVPGHPPIGPGHGPAHRHACLRALALMPGGSA